MPSTYEAFHSAVREIGQLGSIESLLDWDSETIMPEGGLSARAEQISLIATLAHERRTSPQLGEMLEQLQGHVDDPVEQTNVREMRRAYIRATKIPAELVTRLSKVSVIAKEAWGKARAASNFAAFAPHLVELVEIKRHIADLIGFKGERYDALMDEYEPGMTSVEVQKVFSAIRGPLSDFVRQIVHSPRKPDSSVLHRHFPRAAQEAFGRKIAETIGFDFKRGRLDVSKHPFCGGTGPADVRLTTRYYEDFFSPSVFGIMHEAGHGLYEQGLPEKHMFTPAGQAISLGIHESQSRMWENFVGRSLEFWEKMYPDCQRAFPEALGGVSLDVFHGAINTVQASLIRVEADEVTYNLHIILRFEIERDIISGRLEVRDVPAAWNAKMKELLGITPPDDAQGCLQDIHWSAGMFGYFPTYALGNLYGAQFFEAAQRAIPNLRDELRRGQYTPLLAWLRENIHQHGMHYQPVELVRRVTGEPLSVEPFLRYVRAKFGPIYGLNLS